MSEAGKDKAAKAPRGGNPMEKARADAKADKKAAKKYDKLIEKYAACEREALAPGNG